MRIMKSVVFKCVTIGRKHTHNADVICRKKSNPLSHKKGRNLIKGLMLFLPPKWKTGSILRHVILSCINNGLCVCNPLVLKCKTNGARKWWFLLSFFFVFLQELKESFNYGLYAPPCNGKAGKFLEEERPLADYPFSGPVGYLEVRNSAFALILKITKIFAAQIIVMKLVF